MVITLVAGEELKRGDLVFLDKNGKVYKARGKKYSIMFNIKNPIAKGEKLTYEPRD